MNAAEIKALREALGLSQEQLARDLGVSFTTVSRWEQGHTKPSPLAIVKLKEIKRQWEDRVSQEDIIPKKGELVFTTKSGEVASFAHAIVDLKLYDWIERRRPGCTLDSATFEPCGKNRFEITKIGVRRNGS